MSSTGFDQPETPSEEDVIREQPSLKIRVLTNSAVETELEARYRVQIYNTSRSNQTIELSGTCQTTDIEFRFMPPIVTVDPAGESQVIEVVARVLWGNPKTQKSSHFLRIVAQGQSPISEPATAFVRLVQKPSTLPLPPPDWLPPAQLNGQSGWQPLAIAPAERVLQPRASSKPIAVPAKPIRPATPTTERSTDDVLRPPAAALVNDAPPALHTPATSLSVPESLPPLDPTLPIHDSLTHTSQNDTSISSGVQQTSAFAEAEHTSPEAPDVEAQTPLPASAPIEPVDTAVAQVEEKPGTAIVAAESIDDADTILPQNNTPVDSAALSEGVENPPVPVVLVEPQSLLVPLVPRTAKRHKNVPLLVFRLGLLCLAAVVIGVFLMSQNAIIAVIPNTPSAASTTPSAPTYTPTGLPVAQTSTIAPVMATATIPSSPTPIVSPSPPPPNSSIISAIPSLQPTATPLPTDTPKAIVTFRLAPTLVLTIQPSATHAASK